MEKLLANDEQSDYEVDVIDTLDEIGKTEWNDLVSRSSRSTVFHRYEWLDAVETGIGFPAQHIVVKKCGTLIGLFPNVVRRIPKVPFRRLSSVYPGYGGPLLPTDTTKSLSLVIDAIPEMCSGRTIVHEIRVLDPSYLRYNNFLLTKGYQPYLGESRFELDLRKGYEEILDDMSKSRVKALKRGKQHAYEIVEEDVTPENIARFYRVYEQVMDRVDGELLPRPFFERLEDLGSDTLFVTIRIDGEYAGGMIELLDERTSTIHGFKGAVAQEYFECAATELLYDYIFRWGIEHGYDTYDFGMARSDLEHGVFTYKEGFGGRVMPIIIWERGRNGLWKLTRFGRRKYIEHIRS